MATLSEDETLRSLVENAFDFLEKAIAEFEQEPKYSVIHFHAAVELILKARLMTEHWTLVIAKRQDPDWNDFIAGDFQSVNLAEAAKRLQKVARSGLSKSQLEAFREIAKHRNKMMHFFHEAQSQSENQELLHTIVKHQLRAWYFLHQLLKDQWKAVFAPWEQRIEHIDRSLGRYHEYLKHRYKDLQETIAEKIQSGAHFETCPSCTFYSLESSLDLRNPYTERCDVCGLRNRCLRIECNECSQPVVFRGDGWTTCPSCEFEYTVETLIDELIDEGSAYVAAQDGDYDWGRANCSECDGHQTVVFTTEEKWICASCLEVFDRVSQCEWCNEKNTGDMESSYWGGCSQCDGKAGWERDS